MKALAKERRHWVEKETESKTGGESKGGSKDGWRLCLTSSVVQVLSSNGSEAAAGFSPPLNSSISL